MNGFYDEGWNARVKCEPYDSTKSRDWRDGWEDCEDAPESDRDEMA
jgi:hypothetical protein